MNAPVQTAHDVPIQVGRLRQFLAWITPIIFGFVALEAVAYAIFQDWPTGITGIIIFCFGCCLLLASNQLQRGHADRAATLIWVGLLSAASIIIVVQPALFPTLIAIPLLVVAIALPYTRGHALRNLIIVAWLVTIFVAMAGLLLPHQSILPPWFVLLFGVSSLAAAVGLTLLLLWQFSTWMNETLSQMQATNTELHMARIALEAQNEYLSVTLQSIADGVITTDATGKISLLNHTAELLTGWTNAEAIGHSFGAICHLSHEETQIPIEDPIEQVFNNMPLLPPDNQIMIVARDGTARSIAKTAAPIYDRERQIRGVVLVLRDITAYKRATEERMALERKLLETQRLESLGVLAGGIAHDFNNLLTALLGHASLALGDLSPVNPARESIIEIEQAAQRAAKLTEQLLAYVGKGRFISEPLNLNTIIKEVCILLQASIRTHILLELQLDPDLPLIMADVTQIRQVVINLVINALEAIGEQEGHILLTTWVETASPTLLHSATQYVALSIADTGVGMNESTQAKIFEPFFTTKFMGRGLGLAAAQGIIHTHHGTIQVTSVLHQGTTMTVLLPMTATPAHNKPIYSTGRAHNGQDPPAVTTSNATVVLIVDDEANVRMVATQMIQRLGYPVLTAVDGVEAVTVFASHAAQIACILLDVTMPRMNGLETLLALRQIDPSIPVVLMSGYTAEEINVRFAGQQLAGVLHKPFTLPDLQQTLTAIFRK